MALLVTGVPSVALADETTDAPIAVVLEDAPLTEESSPDETLAPVESPAEDTPLAEDLAEETSPDETHTSVESVEDDAGADTELIAPSLISIFSDPPEAGPSTTSTNIYRRWMNSLNEAYWLPLREVNAGHARTIYQGGVKVDSIHHIGAGDSFFLEPVISHPRLAVERTLGNGAYSHHLRCVSPDRQNGPTYRWCTTSEQFMVEIGWVATGKLNSCVQRDDRAPDEVCPDVTVNFTDVFIFNGPRDEDPDPIAPVAQFEAIQSVTNPYEFHFNNTTTDEDSSFSSLSFEWDFGDGATSTQAHPTHTYEQGGTYTVELIVTDPTGMIRRYSTTVEVFSALVVNSAGDDSATDPAVLGCNTGGTIGTPAVTECTLRAAIETANALGGGEITFDIAGSPVIILGGALPTVIGTTSIDGTTQSGGWVEVAGGGAATLALGEGTTVVKGMALHGAYRAIEVTGGSGHVIEGNRLGADLGESARSGTTEGVALLAGAVAAVRNNVITATAFGIANYSEQAIGEIARNHIGVASGGGALGDLEYGVLLFASAPSQISGNTVRGTKGGILVIGAPASGTSVTGNTVGAGIEDAGTGIIIEGASDVTVSTNTVTAGQWGGILVAGSVQVSIEDEVVRFWSPTGEVLDTPATSVGVTITDNTVSAAAGSRGIGSWADAEALTITGNTVTEAGADGGIALTGGAGHEIADNRLGAAGAPLPGSGVQLTDTESPTIKGNTIITDRHGVHISGDGSGASVLENVITAKPDAASAGVLVEDERSGVSVRENTITDAGQAGIEVDAPGVQITENVITGSVHGIVAGGEDVAILENRVGVAKGADTVIGNKATGVFLVSGGGMIRGNVVAGSQGTGIYIAPDAKARVRANRVWQSGGSPINSPIGEVVLEAAVISDTETKRLTTLIVTGVPAVGGGTIEVFGNDSCGASDGEAQYVMGITRDTEAGKTSRVIQFESSRDHFTVTYTDENGATSGLSNCVSRDTHDDADGDGTPDPIEKLVGTQGDPAAAALITRNEETLVLTTGDGTFDQVRLADEPAASRPGGGTMPYGMVSFRITGLAPGGETAVTLALVDPSSSLVGTSYWKYGPATPGAAPSWYNFDYDEVTKTGAQLQAIDIKGVGFRNAHVLALVDGARGDDDGALNGTITDPGGPVVAAAAGPGGPTPGGSTVVPTAPVLPSEPVAEVPIDAGVVAPGDSTLSPDALLPETGGDSSVTAGIAGAGGLFLLLGAILLWRERRRVQV